MISVMKDIETVRFEHVCEACGKRDILLPGEAFDVGWDYPPRMGAWGIVSPRTCGDCAIDKTLWWALTVERKGMDEVSTVQRGVLDRIIAEPAFLENLVK